MPPPSPTHTVWRKTTLFALLMCTAVFSTQAVIPAVAESAVAASPAPDEGYHSRDSKDVARLLSLLSRHYAALEESKKTQPTDRELAQRLAAQRDAADLANIPFSADKVRLNGQEANTALARMTQRLSDKKIPESRRDIVLICAIETRLFGTLIASENRSLKPAGKNQYVARIRLQPGESTLRVGNDLWEVSLPQDINAADYLITLFAPPDRTPEFHIFSIADLLELDKPHIPAWLPTGINLNSSAG